MTTASAIVGHSTPGRGRQFNELHLCLPSIRGDFAAFAPNLP